MIKIISKVSLLNSPECGYTAATFNCNKYVILEPTTNKIVEYSLNKVEQNNIKVFKPYSSIAKAEEVFYMASLNDKNTIYRTTKCYKEIDSFPLKVPKEYLNKINSLALADCENILITNDRKCYLTDKFGNFIKSEISNNSLNTLLGSSTQTINACGCPNTIPKNKNHLTSATIFCNDKYIAYTKDNSAYVALISPNGNIISNTYIDDDIVINSMFNVNNNLQFLVTKNNKYNYIYITNLNCCKCLTNNCEIINCKPDCQNEEYCEIIDNCQNEEYCEIIKNCCHQNNDADIIESIALIEAAISHILNAEGEKIQKAIAITDDTCELLKINDSVNQLIKNITFLEHVLYNKLELAKSCKNDC
ncbi:MAG: hypothetical protein RSB71_01985 [Bacilli bacterium]